MTPTDKAQPDQPIVRGGKFQGKGEYVDIGDTRLFVEERGSGYPILVLHGGPGAIDHRFFGRYLDPLCDRYRLILIDARSHGLSEPAPESTWSFQQLVKDVSSVADMRCWVIPMVLSWHCSTQFHRRGMQHKQSFPLACRRRDFCGSTWSGVYESSSLQSSAISSPHPGNGRRPPKPQRTLPVCFTTRCRSTSPIRSIHASPSSRKSRRRLLMHRLYSVTSPSRIMVRSIVKLT
jgi:hypothetical protein